MNNKTKFRPEALDKDIEQALKVCGLGGDALPGTAQRLVTDYISCLSRLAAKEEQGWISVEDRLPEDLDVTICVNRFGGMWTDQFYGGEWDGERPTHWMPMPAAPATSEKPEEEH